MTSPHARYRSRLLFLPLAALLVGCLPFPHWRRASPDIDGTLLRYDGPLAGVRVALSREEHLRKGDECRNIVQETRTDDSGTFRLRATSSFMPLMLLPEDIKPLWVVCVESAGVLKAASVTRWGGDAPSHARVTCKASESRSMMSEMRLRSPASETFRSESIERVICEQTDPPPKYEYE